MSIENTVIETENVATSETEEPKKTRKTRCDKGVKRAPLGPRDAKKTLENLRKKLGCAKDKVDKYARLVDALTGKILKLQETTDVL